MQRRSFIITGASALAAFKMPMAAGQAEPSLALSEPVANETPTAIMVRQLADELSRRSFVPPTVVAPADLASMGYDQYRDIRFRPEHSVWRSEHLGFELQFFISGYIFPSSVDVFLVEDGHSQRFLAKSSLFDFGPSARLVASDFPIGFSGFRIHAPLKRPDYYDELIAFQGASYFRGLGRNHAYGLSARALALNTAGPDREEFPVFRTFWIERPKDPATITVHGLLDGPSVTGAYTFVIQPGTASVMNVDAILYPRRELANFGIAPLTSMFLKDAYDDDGHRDFRPAVHDSDGLAMWNGQDERLWRPLRNATSKQVSCFRDVSPKGFGLIQRERKFESYQDLEARYERRPSAWVTPKDDWGAGCVELVEIPSRGEYADNIVAYWRPGSELPAGRPYHLAYSLAWCDEAPPWEGLRADKTRVGDGSKPGTTIFVVDFVAPRLLGDPGVAAAASGTNVAAEALGGSLPKAALSASAGTLTEPVIQSNPHTGGIRVSFELDPQGQRVIDLRLVLDRIGRQTSEVWLYRWSAPTS